MGSERLYCYNCGSNGDPETEKSIDPATGRKLCDVCGNQYNMPVKIVVPGRGRGSALETMGSDSK
ncbi:MAG: hypothetical protein KKF56_04885 [Nanoarchaeota archaeon]|nr:hypothetical protein [Nanoarchaeota archaeon]